MACCERVSALNDSTAATPTSAWMTASHAIQFLRPRSSGAAMALPMAMPANTQANMIVNAYAVGRKNSTSIRNQMISSANDITPETKKTHKTTAAPRAGTSGTAGTAGTAGTTGTTDAAGAACAMYEAATATTP